MAWSDPPSGDLSELERAMDHVPPKMVTDWLGGMDAHWAFMGGCVFCPLTSETIPVCRMSMELIGVDKHGFIYAGRCPKTRVGLWFRGA